MNAAKIMNIVQNTKYLRKFNMVECCFEIFLTKSTKIIKIFVVVKFFFYFCA